MATDSIRSDLRGAGLAPRRPDLWTGATDPATEEFLAEGGWHCIDGRSGDEQKRGGLTHSSGPVADDEYVDQERLASLIAERLGFDLDDLRACYGSAGRLAGRLTELRDRIDARLAEMAGTGCNMTLLAGALEMGERQMDRALARARAAA